MTAMTAVSVPAQRHDPDQPLAPQMRYAAQLMRRLWACDMEAADELIAGLEGLNRVELGRIIDNLMWTLADQPRVMNTAQERHIRMLWAAKMAKPIDAKVEMQLAKLHYEEATRWIQRLQALPDRRPA